MKVYEVVLKPLSAFGTPLKGDTVFGHICWQLAVDDSLLGGPLEDLLAGYDTRPFAVFSSAVTSLIVDGRRVYLLKTPSLPPEHLFHLPEDKVEKIRQRKVFKSRKWMIIREGERLDRFVGQEFRNNREIAELVPGSDGMPPSVADSQAHNTINRLTGRTGEGGFAPYAVEQEVFGPAAELVLFIAVDPELSSIEGIRLCLERIGETGFGRDASTGMGRFRVQSCKTFDLAGLGSADPNACYTLGPCVPGPAGWGRMFFAPFTRFGKHGDVLAKSDNPFKNPVIMAEEGAVLFPTDPGMFARPYVGTSLRGLSKAQQDTVAQGYTLFIPVRLEV